MDGGIMFRLQRIEIDGFKSEDKHIEYEFSDSNTTVGEYHK